MAALGGPASLGEQRATATYAAALLLTPAREEAADRRPQRLTETDLEPWKPLCRRANA